MQLRHYSINSCAKIRVQKFAKIQSFSQRKWPSISHFFNGISFRLAIADLSILIPHYRHLALANYWFLFHVQAKAVQDLCAQMEAMPRSKKRRIYLMVGACSIILPALWIVAGQMVLRRVYDYCSADLIE